MTTNKAPRIKKLQHNLKVQPDVEATYDYDLGDREVPFEPVENINHEKAAIRIVFENGNWIEYRKLDDETMEECVFVQEQHPTGQYEAFLVDSVEIGALEIRSTDQFIRAVDTSVEVYQEDVETIEDAERMWENIVPALQD